LDTDPLRRDHTIDRRWPLEAVPAADSLQAALATLRRSSSHLARVVDEDGSTRGVLTLEDILEELVGEVTDATRRRPPT
jgi:CBS domain containing-hemolysin-like protein